MVNILLTSVGRRSYLVKYFKESLGANGIVHVSNSSNLTPAFKYADKSIVTPLIYEEDYIPFLLQYCRANSIDAIISLFDIDLPILSKNKKAFEKIGTRIVVSDESVINICNDKLETHKFLNDNGFRTPKTYTSINTALSAISDNKIGYPVIIKPRWGMGSIGVYEADNELELKVLYNKVIKNIKESYLKYESKDLDESVIIQEKLIGKEYGLDVINNLESEYENTIVKEKYAMRSGETDCAKTVNIPVLKELGKQISKKLHHIANLDVDVFLVKDTPYILEMNSRFGGGYPFSHMAGVDLPTTIVSWLKGENYNPELLIERVDVISHKDISIVDMI